MIYTDRDSKEKALADELSSLSGVLSACEFLLEAKSGIAPYASNIDAVRMDLIPRVRESLARLVKEQWAMPDHVE